MVPIPHQSNRVVARLEGVAEPVLAEHPGRDVGRIPRPVGVHPREERTVHIPREIHRVQTGFRNLLRHPRPRGEQVIGPLDVVRVFRRKDGRFPRELPCGTALRPERLVHPHRDNVGRSGPLGQHRIVNPRMAGPEGHAGVCRLEPVLHQHDGVAVPIPCGFVLLTRRLKDVVGCAVPHPHNLERLGQPLPHRVREVRMDDVDIRILGDLPRPRKGRVYQCAVQPCEAFSLRQGFSDPVHTGPVLDGPVYDFHTAPAAPAVAGAAR